MTLTHTFLSPFPMGASAFLRLPVVSNGPLVYRVTSTDIGFAASSINVDVYRHAIPVWGPAPTWTADGVVNAIAAGVPEPGASVTPISGGFEVVVALGLGGDAAEVTALVISATDADETQTIGNPPSFLFLPPFGFRMVSTGPYFGRLANNRTTTRVFPSNPANRYQTNVVAVDAVFPARDPFLIPPLHLWDIVSPVDGATGVSTSTSIVANLTIADENIDVSRFVLGVGIRPADNAVLARDAYPTFVSGWAGSIVVSEDAHTAIITISKTGGYTDGNVVVPFFYYFPNAAMDVIIGGEGDIINGPTNWSFTIGSGPPPVDVFVDIGNDPNATPVNPPWEFTVIEPPGAALIWPDNGGFKVALTAPGVVDGEYFIHVGYTATTADPQMGGSFPGSNRVTFRGGKAAFVTKELPVGINQTLTIRPLTGNAGLIDPSIGVHVTKPCHYPSTYRLRGQFAESMDVGPRSIEEA